MILSKTNIITKIHLFISVIIVLPVSFIYGFVPQTKFNISLSTIDEYNFFKAIMGLYIGFSLLWAIALFKNKYLKSALLSNMIFMLGLAFGRLLSIFIDGTPSLIFIFGTIGEFLIGLYGFWVINNKKLIFAEK